jgi:hypothetical protein
MGMVTSCVLKIPTVPFYRWNCRILEELERRSGNGLYGFHQVDENPTMSDAEWFGWTAAYYASATVISNDGYITMRNVNCINHLKPIYAS